MQAHTCGTGPGEAPASGLRGRPCCCCCLWTRAVLPPPPPPSAAAVGGFTELGPSPACARRCDLLRHIGLAKMPLLACKRSAMSPRPPARRSSRPWRGLLHSELQKSPCETGCALLGCPVQGHSGPCKLSPEGDGEEKGASSLPMEGSRGPAGRPLNGERTGRGFLYDS